MKSRKQQEIISVLSDNGNKMTLAEIYQKTSFSYYHNWRKHLSALLGNMVKRGMIIREKRGVYSLDLGESLFFKQDLMKEEIMDDYILLSEQKPEPNKDIEYIESDGSHGYAYLCGRCRNCWRCTITGGGLLIDVVKWRYCI